MRLRAFDLLVAFLASTLSVHTSNAVSVYRAPRPQNHFYVAKSAHPGRDHHPAGRQLYVESTDSRTRLENWVLEDYVLVSTVEGELYSLDRHSGDVRWGLSGGEAVVDTLQSEEGANATNETLTGREPRWIVQPVDGGQLYLFDKELGVLQVPLTVKELIDHAPFSIPGDDKVYTGRKETLFMAVDSATGEIISRYGNPVAASRGVKCLEPKAIKDNDRDEQCDALAAANNVLMIGKTVYHLTITSAKEPMWDVTYTEWTPNMIDSRLSGHYVKVQDDLYICPSSDGQIYMHNPAHAPPLWTKTLPSSTINAFDVFRPAFKDPSQYKDPPSLVLIRQPPSPYFKKPRTDKVTTFLNTTQEGAWYALSTDRFPLLAAHVESAPWVDCHAHNETAHPEETCNMTRTDLVGIHPIAKTLEMNIDDPPPAEHHHHFGLRNLVSLYLFIAIPIFAFWKRRAIMQGRLFRGLRPRSTLSDQEALEESIESIPLTEKLPLEEDEVPLAGPSHGEPSAQVDPTAPTNPDKKRRKRGTRGGKNGKKKATDGQCMTEIDIAELPEKTPLLNSSPDENTHTIDGLTITSRLLGAGSQGTFVYEGAWDGIRVAVKRMQLENFSLAEKEIRTLRESDEVLHPNIVRYYTNKRNDRFIYIALELCPATLEQIIAHPNDEGFAALADGLPPQYALAQIASGLQFLHSLHIVHRDLKPQNILVAPAKLRGTVLPKSPLWRHYKADLTRCLISDFGLGRKLEPGNSTFAAHSNGGAAGTSGWRAPEVLRGVDKGKGVMSSEDVSPASTPPPEMGLTRRITRAVDIFSMGCLFYYVLTDGEHPFGNRTYLRDGRILDNDFDLSGLDTSTNEGVEARDLISRMISPNPRDRPRAAEVLEHPYFWDEKRRTDFILEFSDRLSGKETPSTVVERVEVNAAEICGRDWTRVVDDALMKESKVNRSYDGTKVNDLMRLIRNKKNHIHDLPETLKKRLNEFEPGGYIGYFLYKRFPKLLLHLYHIHEEVGWSNIAS